MRRLLRAIFFVDLIEGLWVTFRSQHPKKICTEQYPAERPKVAERYRGAPRLNINPDTGETLCIGCNLCALACPEHLIVVTTERNEETDVLDTVRAHRKVPRGGFAHWHKFESMRAASGRSGRSARLSQGAVQ